MEKVIDCKFKVSQVFGAEDVSLTLYKGVTFLVGANGTGKTQTLRSLSQFLRNQKMKVRYLSANRIGNMEPYRSKCNRYLEDINHFSFGGQERKGYREELETATGDFFTMDVRRDVYIKVAERLGVLFGRQVFLRWDAGNLKVFVARTASQGEYSVVAEASGLVNLMSILAAAYDPDHNFLLIDEPEVSLHPQLQAYLLSEIWTASKLLSKTIVLSTHSQSMVNIVRPEDVCRYVFFVDGMVPRQVDPSNDVLKSTKLQEFLWRMGEIYKLGFFAKRVLLIEGVSDLIVCKAIARQLSLSLDVAGTQILPVDGKGQFPAVAKLFSLIGKEVSLLTDLDGFLDNENVIGVFNQSAESHLVANELGATEMSELSRKVKSTLSQLLGRTKASLGTVYMNHPYYLKESQGDLERDEERRSLVLRRAVVAELFTREEAEISRWDAGTEWCALRRCMESVLDAFEKLGCHVLRKGAIESYYHFASNRVYDEKPSSAIVESEGMVGLSCAEVEKYYDVVVRSLKRVSSSDRVDESAAVIKELLLELPRALYEIEQHPTAKSGYINSVIKQVRGVSNPLFGYEVISAEGRIGLRVTNLAPTLRIEGMPLDVFVGDNVNQVVSAKVRCASMT